MAAHTLSVSEIEARIEQRIDEALTPAVLSKLAFKGITPAMARDYLRACVARDVAKAFA